MVIDYGSIVYATLYPVIITKTRQDIKDVLMEPKAPGINDAYFILPVDNQKITIVASGNNGKEFNKTYGYFHKTQTAEVFHCLYGQGLLIMQRNDDNGEAKEFKVASLNQGRQMSVPAGFGHTLINIGKTFLVVLDNAPLPGESDYNSLKTKQGFAYYIVLKKGEIAFEPNLNYLVHPQITPE